METVSLTLDNLNLVIYPFHAACMNRKPAMVNNAVGIFLRVLAKAITGLSLLCCAENTSNQEISQRIWHIYNARAFSDSL